MEVPGYERKSHDNFFNYTDDQLLNKQLALKTLKEIYPDVSTYYAELVYDLCSNSSQEEIDKIIQECSDNWILERMTVIDRNILRMGTCELLFDFLTPPKVVINEAIDIAKKYGNEDSPEFINGILDKIHKKIGHKGILPLPI